MNAENFLRQIGAAMTKGIVVVENQSVRDIINLIKYKHQKHEADYDKIAPYFWTGDIESTAKKLFDWCKKNIDYRIENEEKQTVSSPAKILTKKNGDCKHFASFINGVLASLDRSGIPIDWYYRFASYNPFDDNPGHVFAVIKRRGQPEIWIDPVLDVFDYHKPYQSAIDKKVKSVAVMGSTEFRINQMRGNMMRRSRLGLSAMTPLECVGATTAQTGQSIMKLTAAASPYLATVPVVGWIAIGVGALAGGVLSILGDKHIQSSDVLWLVQLYQQNVLGQQGITATNANDALTPQAQGWFTIVLGVPIGARSDFNILQTGDTNSNHPSSLSDQERGSRYIIWKNLSGKITPEQATEAAHIAATSMNPYEATPKSWAYMKAAPSLQQLNAAAPGSPGASEAAMSPWIMYIMIGTLVYFILNPGKRKPIKRRA